jgi:hypothetical protein
MLLSSRLYYVCGGTIMAFKVGSTAIFPGMYTAPNSSSAGSTLFSNGTATYWGYPGEINTVISSGFQYRSIFTHGFLAAGYKNSNPWRSVNKTWHATDITLYCGEQLDRAGGYIDGMFSDYNGYVTGTAWNEGSQSDARVHTSSINLHNGAARTRGYGSYGTGPKSGTTTPTFGYQGLNPNADGINYGDGYQAEGTNDPGVGGWDMSVPRHTHGGFTDQVDQRGYAIGGGYSAVDKMDFPTETMYTSSTSSTVAGGATTGGFGQTVGLATFGSGSNYKMAFSNDSWSSWGGSAGSNTGSDGYRKFLNTKLGYTYQGTSSNVTLGWAQLNDTTGAIITSFNGISAVGEENLEMGQNWGYMMGNYNGQQNNMAWKFTYSNNAITALGPVGQPKGHNGQSSGICFSAAGSIAASRYA